MEGRLRAGERLPPSRELADSLDVSRNTVTIAYEQLAAEGVVSGRIGSGTFVTTEPLISQIRTRRAPAGAVRPRRRWESISTWDVQSPSPPYDFRVGFPDGRLFPWTTWRRLVARELVRGSLQAPGYAGPAGYPALREAIAGHIGLSRAVRASADDVIVTQGAQQALDVIGRVLIDPNSHVAVEEPGYPPARKLFESLGARIVGVPVDAEGLDVRALPKAVKLVYVTPSHQFPLGMPMSLQRRAALLSWADRNAALIIEDDYDSEFRFAGRPLDSLQGLDRLGRVIYVGSFSKTMLPMFRLGFLVAPASLQPALRAAKQLTDWHGEIPTQAALARFINEGLLARHIRKAGHVYAERRRLIAEAVESDLGRWLQLAPSVAGLHVAALAKPGASAIMASVAHRARVSGVGVDDVGRFYAARPGRAGLLIGYGAIPTEKIAEGVRRLAAAFRR